MGKEKRMKIDGRRQEQIVSPYKLVRRKGVVRIEKRPMVDREFHKHTKLVGDTLLMLPNKVYINSLKIHAKALRKRVQ